MQLYSKQNPVRNLSKWVICCVLWLGTPCFSSPPTFSRQDPTTGEKLVCQQCPPGTHLGKECTKDSPTICTPCPHHHYTQYWNYLKKCLYCNVFCNSLEEEAHPCNGTHNRACRCKAGYHADLDFCVKHSPCPLGSGVVQFGNFQEDTKCVPCPQGTFSGSVSSTAECKQHQSCPELGLEVNVPGNQFHNTICTACRISKDNDSSNMADEASGTGNDCSEAVTDFVPFQVASRRRLLRLKRLLTCGTFFPENQDKKNPEQLQIELHKCIIQLKSTEGSAVVVQKLLKALNQMKLQRVLDKIQKRFSVSL